MSKRGTSVGQCRGRVKLFCYALLLTLFTMVPSFSIAGTCPSTVPAGVTNCFYIDYVGGSDSSSGASEATPWRHAPSMANATANAASHIPGPGEGWIFKGGVAVDFHAFPMNVPWGGSSGQPDYMGYDLAWFAGTSWSRSIFNGGGSSGFDARGSSLVSDSIHHASFLIVDNIEFTGLYWGSTCSNAPNSCGYIAQYAYSGSDTNWELKNLYAHGWSHCPAPTCNDPSNEVSLFWAAQDSTNSSIHDSVVDGADSSQDCCNAMAAQNEFNNYIAYVDNAEFGAIHLFHDNVIANMIVTFQTSNSPPHGNCIHLFGGGNMSELIYNNYVSCNPGTTDDEMFLVEEDSATVYAFNNVLVNDGHGSMFELGIFNSGPGGTYVIFNNTSECGTEPSPGSSCLTGKNGSPTVTAADNFWITNNSSQQTVLRESGSSWKLSTPSPLSSKACSGGAETNTGGTQICAPIGTGNGTGNLNILETFPFAPLDLQANGTIGTGSNHQSYCSNIGAIDSGAGKACLLDTTLGVKYNQANHTVSYPARTPVSRPSGGWTIGAYQFGSGPANPTNLTAVVH